MPNVRCKTCLWFDDSIFMDDGMGMCTKEQNIQSENDYCGMWLFG